MLNQRTFLAALGILLNACLQGSGATAIAASATSVSSRFTIAYPDSWVTYLDGSSGTGVTIATSHSAILGHAAGINSGDAVISVAPLLSGEDELTERDRFERSGSPLPVFTPGSSAEPGRIEIVQEGVTQIVLYCHLGGVIYAVNLQYNDGDPKAADFRQVQADVCSSITRPTP